MLAGFKLLQERVPDARLVIVGCSPPVTQQGVEVLGYLSPSIAANRTRVARLFAESACFCMLSDFEPLGNVFVEAYACGTPVIAFDQGSRSEIVIPSESGILCRDRMPETVAAAMERLLLDEKFRERVGMNARRLATEKFNWSRVAERIRSQVFRTHAMEDGGLGSESPEVALCC